MIDIGRLKEEQRKLAEKVSIIDRHKTPKTIGGCEQFYAENKVTTAIVVCENRSFTVLEKNHASFETKTPYKSGFQFYREGPSIIEAFNKLEQKPDILMVNGNGILHPRRIGIASHIGILLDTSTIGIAKRLMLGELREGTIYIDKEARGYEFFSKQHAKPLYISPGHAVSLRAAQELVKESVKFPHKLPEPLHLAHRYANKLKKAKSEQ